MNAAEQVKCASCGELTPAAGRFCIHCAAPLQQTCPNCGAPVVAGARFCMQCATPLTVTAATSRPSGPEALSERRLVSVLFADLVGFTALSERRDPEEVRELLSRYFETCRTIIERYGGTVEKFIGDAVMAVWGTPVAREDDAERAARAALALVQRVAALGEEVAMPGLRLRAGVLTGNAAVEVGAEGEGMVLGDTVNTASRLQSIAEPGTVLVDDATRRASEAAIAYEDAGTHAVKGREQPVRAWVALRVVAGAGGARRSAGLEAPFMGRDRELQAIIEAGEESAQQNKARYVAIAGEAGAGKSRLMWEYFKYLDGIQELRLWHQGRCLSYGEGVAYWALAEMVRTRARIQEEENPAAARDKLRAIVEEYVPEERERRLVEPRLAHLLRLEERPEADRADLFSGWRSVLRAALSRGAGHPRVRGPPVGRQRPARLHRLPPRMVCSLPDLRARAGQAGIARTQARMGAHGARPAGAAGDSGSARWPRARATGGRGGTDRRALGRDPAVRRRDDPHAPGSRRARSGGRPLPRHGGPLGPRGSGDPPRACRIPARRAVLRGALAAAGRLSARSFLFGDLGCRDWRAPRITGGRTPRWPCAQTDSGP